MTRGFEMPALRGRIYLRLGPGALAAMLIAAPGVCQTGSREPLIVSPRSGDLIGRDKVTVRIQLGPSEVKTIEAIRLKVQESKYDSGSLRVIKKPEEDRVTITYDVTLQKAAAGGTPAKNTILLMSAADNKELDRVEVWQLHCSDHFDERQDMEASAYVGIAIDTFAASELKNYLNPGVSGELTERAVAGFNFDYRLLGDPARPSSQQLWVYGETVHGMRSADVDCSKTPNIPTCATFDPKKPEQAFIYMLRNATSLEAFAGLRWEFATLQKHGLPPARVYLKGQFGFLTVTRGGSDLVDMHHVGLGLVATRGRFLDSHLEAGYGKTDLFLKHPNGRLKIDGHLTWQPNWMKSLGLRPFAQMTVDSDGRRGADSVQTYLGISFDLDRLFGP